MGEQLEDRKLQPGVIGQTERRVNYRRGFNRAFAVVCVMYGVWFLWLLWRWNEETRSQLFSSAQDSFERCTQSKEECSKAYAAELKEISNRFPSPFGITWRESWVLPVGLIVPPSLIYGLIIAIVRLIRWVYSGFLPGSAVRR